MVFTVTKYFSCYRIKEYGIGGAHDTYGKDVHKGSGGDTLRKPETSKA
jgi:hypothetical protein